MSITLSKYGVKLESYDPTSIMGVPGLRRIHVNTLKDDFIDSIAIDTRDNSLVIENKLEEGYFQLCMWLYRSFDEYKKTDFKFGVNGYEPTVQMSIDNFLMYLKSKNRDEVIESIL